MLSRAVLALCSLDLPAQSIVLNMKQFNGRFACNCCEHEGVPRPSSHLHRNWPYQPDIAPRTHKSFIENAKKSVLSHSSVSLQT